MDDTTQLLPMAGRHLDPIEGVMQVGHVVTDTDLSALRLVLDAAAEVDRLRVERDALAAAVLALADQWEEHADSLCDQYAPDLIDTVQTYRHCAKALRSTSRAVLADHTGE